MKLYFLPFVLALGWWPVSNLSQHQAIPSTFTVACGETPELNKKIIDYVNSQMNKKVGRGECWDLAAGALNSTGAKWDKAYRYGNEIDVKKDCVYPGDIIQFENVVVEYSNGTTKYKEKMAQHTAVIYEVKGPGDFIMADQNTSVHGRKVGLSPMNLNTITKGKYKLYQPVTN